MKKIPESHQVVCFRTSVTFYKAFKLLSKLRVSCCHFTISYLLPFGETEQPISFFLCS